MILTFLLMHLLPLFSLIIGLEKKGKTRLLASARQGVTSIFTTFTFTGTSTEGRHACSPVMVMAEIRKGMMN